MFMTRHWSLFGILCGAMLVAASPASAKCTVTLKFTNNDTHAVTVLGDNSQSRVNGGTWSKMGFNDVTIQPGATANASWTTNMSCGGHAKRDLRFRYQDSGDNNVYMFSASNLDLEPAALYSYTIRND
jgi:hypothetical protein